MRIKYSQTHNSSIKNVIWIVSNIYTCDSWHAFIISSQLNGVCPHFFVVIISAKWCLSPFLCCPHFFVVPISLLSPFLCPHFLPKKQHEDKMVIVVWDNAPCHRPMIHREIPGLKALADNIPAMKKMLGYEWI